MKLLIYSLTLMLLMACTFTSMPPCKANAPAVAQTNGYIIVKGRYYNYDYAYSVSVPRGLVGFRNPAPAPNHGFGIDLSKPQRSYLWVDASYNAAELKSFDVTLKESLGYLKDEGCINISVSQRTSTRLSKLRAARFVIRYKDPQSGENMVRDQIIALRKAKGEVGIVYEIALRTPEYRYSKDKDVLARTQRTWRLEPLP
jgi:hypothetical protein